MAVETVGVLVGAGARGAAVRDGVVDEMVGASSKVPATHRTPSVTVPSSSKVLTTASRRIAGRKDRVGGVGDTTVGMGVGRGDDGGSARGAGIGVGAGTTASPPSTGGNAVAIGAGVPRSRSAADWLTPATGAAGGAELAGLSIAVGSIG